MNKIIVVMVLMLIVSSLCAAQFTKSLVFFGKGKKATTLNGTTQYWSKTTPDSVRFGGFSVLMMAWVRTNANANQIIVGSYKSAAAGRSMALTIESGQIPYVWVSVDGNTGVSRALDATITLGKWYHVAGLFYASNLNIYINGRIANGSLTGTAPSALFDPVGTPLTVGVNGNFSAGFFNGDIGEVQIIRFSSLPSGLADIIKRNATRKTFDRIYPNGEVVFWTKWGSNGIDLSGKNNSIAPTGEPLILNVQY